MRAADLRLHADQLLMVLRLAGMAASVASIKFTTTIQAHAANPFLCLK